MKPEHIHVIEVHVHPDPGAEIGDCFREAIEMAAREWRNVVLCYDGVAYRVRPNDLLSVIMKVKNNHS